jgi:hypothetical protein
MLSNLLIIPTNSCATHRQRIADIANFMALPLRCRCRDVMPYSGPAVSAFQKLMRSKAEVLRDHICKEMNELNLERCR